MVYCNHEASFEAVVRDIFRFAGYTVSANELRDDYRFDFIAEDDGRTYAVEVKSRPQHYSVLVPLLKELVTRAITRENGNQVLPVIVFAGVVDDAVRSKIDEIDSSITILDIRNLLYATPANSNTWDELLAAIPYSADEIIPVKSDMLRMRMNGDDPSALLLEMLDDLLMKLEK